MTPISLEEITVQALKPLLGDGENSAHEKMIQLIDVREPQELELASLPGFQNFPLSQYQVWAETVLQQLDPHQETYVLCHHGMRSAQMCGWLIEQGFTSVKNIAGGIDAYSLKVDSNVPRY